jgi:hypothetical protein
MSFDKNKIYISFLEKVAKLITQNIESIEPDECIKMICNEFSFKIDSDKLYVIYMEKLENILQQHTEISTIEPLMMVGLVCSILEENKELILK